MSGVLYDKVKKEDEANEEEGGVELEAIAARFEVRVLDVKHQGAQHTVKVRDGGTVNDLQAAVAALLDHAPVARQRLIMGGRQLAAGAPLSDYGLARGEPLRTVHLMVRPADAPPVAVAVAADASSGGDVANPLARDLASMIAAAAARGDAAAITASGAPHRPGLGARLGLERVARAAARVRLLSSLLALYCALNGLGALLDATADPAAYPRQTPRPSPALATAELALDAAGVWVGAAGMRASTRLDIASADGFDRSLRALAVVSLSYETYNSLVVLPNALAERPAQAVFDDPSSETPPRNGTATPRPSTAPIEWDDAAGPPIVASDGALTRESLLLSGVVTVLLWASIWLVCVQNATRLRVILREHAATATAADLQLAVTRGDAALFV